MKFKPLINVQQYCLLLFSAFSAVKIDKKVSFFIKFSSKTQGLQLSANYENFFFFILGISITRLLTCFG